jgi:hypothetical protein
MKKIRRKVTKIELRGVMQRFLRARRADDADMVQEYIDEATTQDGLKYFDQFANNFDGLLEDFDLYKQMAEKEYSQEAE